MCSNINLIAANAVACGPLAVANDLRQLNLRGFVCVRSNRGGVYLPTDVQHCVPRTLRRAGYSTPSLFDQSEILLQGWHTRTHGIAVCVLGKRGGLDCLTLVRQRFDLVVNLGGQVSCGFGEFERSAQGVFAKLGKLLNCFRYSNACCFLQLHGDGGDFLELRRGNPGAAC